MFTRDNLAKNVNTNEYSTSRDFYLIRQISLLRGSFSFINYTSIHTELNIIDGKYEI